MKILRFSLQKFCFFHASFTFEVLDIVDFLFQQEKKHYEIRTIDPSIDSRVQYFNIPM